MKELDEQIIWKFLDGNCSEEERNQVESILQIQPELLEDFEMKRLLHTQLSDVELESPSLDFTSKIMAAIPEPQAISEIQPLLSPIWKKVGIASCTILFLSCIFLLFSYTPTQVELPLLNKISSYNEVFNSMIYSIATSTYEFIGLVVLSLGSLAFLDLFLKKKFNNRDLSL